jgi:hypothetical protein
MAQRYPEHVAEVCVMTERGLRALVDGAVPSGWAQRSDWPQYRFHVLMSVVRAKMQSDSEYRVAVMFTGVAGVVYKSKTPYLGAGTLEKPDRNALGRCVRALRDQKTQEEAESHHNHQPL